MRRRFEVRARIRGITVIDDYAHHPTEVAATIAAARLGGPRRVVAVFQPHRFSRTAEHAGRFGAALATADRVVLTDVYAAGEAPVPGVSGRLVADAAVAAGAAVSYVPRRNDLAGVVAAEAQAGGPGPAHGGRGHHPGGRGAGRDARGGAVTTLADLAAAGHPGAGRSRWPR